MSLGPRVTMFSPKLPSADTPAGRGQRLQRPGDRALRIRIPSTIAVAMNTSSDCDQQPVAPVLRAGEIGESPSERIVAEMGVLSVEKVPDAVEFGLPAFAWRRCPQCRRRPGVTAAISGSAYSARQSAAACSMASRSAICSGRSPTRCRSRSAACSLGARAVEVGVEELPVGGDHVPAEGGLLIAQRGLQLVRRHARRLDALD